ncbi:TraR/DksA family transcriptional regulator [Planctomicrobium sp. SH668]|uniref:TraR/DksA family transcriptional regulator n=1 Tax=Planctomicrobium sp. SH668 TaxID=3448126 RepID=UPI003F5B3A73
MARKDALLRLHERLLIQREELARKIFSPESEFGDDVGGDSGDLAFHDTEKELQSQLVSLESRELARIDRAIDAIRNGTYGLCEHCETRIPVARLQALPHTSCCVECQRKYENRRSYGVDKQNWESAWEFQANQSDRDLTMRDLQIEME